MKPISLTQEAHSLIKQKLHSGDIAIDATVGNGYDTLFLAKQVGTTGKVYGFDIQQAALDATRSRLQQANLLECLTLAPGQSCRHGRKNSCTIPRQDQRHYV